MKRYKIEEYKNFENVRIYTVKFDDEKNNETDRFISRFINSEKHKDDFSTIIYWINKIGSSGVLERYFRTENRALAIPVESGKNLRLYCFRVNDNILILGNGGVKTSKKVQNSQDCLPHFELMNHVAKKLYWGLHDKKINIEDGQLIGLLEYNYQ